MAVSFVRPNRKSEIAAKKAPVASASFVRPERFISPEDQDKRLRGEEPDYFKNIKGQSLEKKENFLKKIAKAGGKAALDAIDILNTVSYGVGGLIDGKSPIEGIKQKISPSQALGIENFWGGLAVDILTDPLTYVTFGTGAGVKGAVTGTGKVVKGTTKLAGKTLSPKGASALSKAFKGLQKNAIKKLGVESAKDLPVKVSDDLFQKAKVLIAKQAEKNPELISKFGMGLEIPFTQRAIRLFDVQAPEFVQKAGQLVMKTPAAKVIRPIATGMDETKKFMDNVFKGKRAKILNSDATLAAKEQALQLLAKTKNASRNVITDVIDKIKPIVKKNGDDVFDSARYFVEKVPNGSTSKIVRSAVGLVDEAVSTGELPKAVAGRIKNVIKEVIPISKKVEKDLLEAGVLKGTTKIAYWPRTADLEEMGRKVFTQGSPSMLKASKQFPRKIVELVEEGGRGERFIAKVTDAGRAAKIISEPEVAAKVTREVVEEAPKKALVKGEKVVFKPAKQVAKAKEQIAKESAKKIKTQTDIITEAKAKIARQTGKPFIKGQKTIPQLKQQIRTAEKKIEKLKLDRIGKLEKVTKKLKEGDVFVKKGRVFRVQDATVDAIQRRTGIKYEGALTSLTKKLAQTGNVLTTNKIVKDLTESVGKLDGLGIKKKIGAVDQGFVDLYEFTGKVPAAKGWQIPKETADLFKGYLKFASEPTEIDTFMKKFIDPVQQWWKAMALTGVAYHTRNAISDTFNMWLGGVKNPATLLKDMDTYVKTTGLGKKIGRKVTPKQKELLTAARELGVIGDTFFGTELAKTIVDEVKRPGFNPLSTKGFLVKGSQFVGEIGENARRFGLFMDQVRKGRTVSEAAEHVKKFLFDYADLSRTEQKVFKRIVPFYTFMRKNLPLQVENLVTHPGKVATLQKFERHIQPKNAEEIKENLPEWLKEEHPIILPWKDKEGNPIAINAEGVLPIYDLSVIGKNPFREILNMMTPLLKVPAELAFNVDTFRDFQKIVRDAEDNSSVLLDLFDTEGSKVKAKFLGGLFNEAQAHVIRGAVRPLRDIDNLFQPGRTDKERQDQWRRILKFTLLSAQPVDVVESKSFEQYMKGKNRDDALNLYKKTFKKHLDTGSPIEEKNLDILKENYLKAFNVTEEELREQGIKAAKEHIKFNKFLKEVRQKVAAGETVDVKDKVRIALELKPLYSKKTKIETIVKQLNKMEAEEILKRDIEHIKKTKGKVSTEDKLRLSIKIKPLYGKAKEETIFKDVTEIVNKLQQ